MHAGKQMSVGRDERARDHFCITRLNFPVHTRGLVSSSSAMLPLLLAGAPSFLPQVPTSPPPSPRHRLNTGPGQCADDAVDVAVVDAPGTCMYERMMIRRM